MSSRARPIRTPTTCYALLVLTCCDGLGVVGPAAYREALCVSLEPERRFPIKRLGEVSEI